MEVDFLFVRDLEKSHSCWMRGYKVVPMESIGSIGHESNDALVSRQDWACKFVTFRLVSAISRK